MGQSRSGLQAGSEGDMPGLAGSRRILVLVGAYGSGKSEVAVNLALRMAGSGPVLLADLDAVNPFYRSADARTRLEEAGVRLVAPVTAGTNVEVPAMPAGLLSAFDQESLRGVLDIGGDDLGARVVRTLRPRLLSASMAVLMVANLYRPFTGDPDGLLGMAASLEDAMGLPLDGFIHNSHLLEPGDRALAAAREAMAETARRAGLPVVFEAALAEAVQVPGFESRPGGLPILRMERTIRYAY